MKDVEERLGLTREKLVAMALLLGCDYLPKGVPGVGVERAVKLMNSLPSCNILERCGCLLGKLLTKLEQCFRAVLYLFCLLDWSKLI